MTKEQHPTGADADSPAETLATVDVGKLFARLEKLAVDITDTAQKNVVGFGKKQVQVLNQLLTFLEAVHVQEQRRTGNELETNIVSSPFSVSLVEKDIVAMQQLVTDTDFPQTDRDAALSHWNQLLTSLQSVVRSFELQRGGGWLSRILWPINGPFLRDKVAKYRTQHGLAMSLYGSQREYLTAIESLLADNRETGIRDLKRKMAQGAWEELFSSLTQEAQLKAMGVSARRNVLDSPYMEQVETRHTLSKEPWSPQQRAEQQKLHDDFFAALKQAKKSDALEAGVLTNYEQLWLLATDANDADLDAQSSLNIIVGTQQLLEALRARGFTKIIAKFLTSRK